MNNLIANDLAKQIKAIIANARDNVSTTINNEIVLAYWKIGEVIVAKEKQRSLDMTSSRKIILELSKILSKEIGKGYSRSNLFYMRSFYMDYKDVQTLSGQLRWSHYCELLTISDKDRRSFYEKECQHSNWSVRELKRQVKSSLFERLMLSDGNANKEKLLKLSTEGNIINSPADIIKDPYIFEFLGIPENKPMLEKDLELRLIQNIEKFFLNGKTTHMLRRRSMNAYIT